MFRQGIFKFKVAFIFKVIVQTLIRFKIFKNIINFLKLIVNKGEMNLNFEDDIVLATCIAHQGQVMSERLKTAMGK